jgi:hypothetical protein
VPLVSELDPCGWRWPHQRRTLMRPFGDGVGDTIRNPKGQKSIQLNSQHIIHEGSAVNSGVAILVIRNCQYRLPC